MTWKFIKNRFPIQYARLITAVLLIFLYMPCFGQQVESKRLLIVGFDKNYPPYEFIDSKGDPCGYNVDLTMAIADMMGVEVKFKAGTWIQIRQWLEDGTIDAVHGMYYSPERAQYFDFSPPHMTVQQGIFLRKGSEIKTAQDLRGKEIIAVTGDIMHDYLIKEKTAGKILTADTQPIALRMLASGKGDCAVISKYVGLYWIHKLKLDNITFLETPLKTERYCYAVKKGNSELKEMLSEGLAILKLSGKYQLIFDKWFGVLEPKGLTAEKILKYAAIVLVPVFVLVLAVFLLSLMLERKLLKRTKELREEILERKETEKSLKKANRHLKMLIYCNQILARVLDEQQLFKEICGIVVQTGGYKMAWVGLAVKDEGKTVKPIVWAGCEDGYLKNIRVSWDTNEYGMGPTGTAIRSGEPCINRNVEQNPFYKIWKHEAVKRGYMSSAALPIRSGEQIIGALNIYSSEVNAFNDDELEVLKDLADDLSIGIKSLRDTEERKKAELSLRVGEQCFRAIADYTFFCEIWISPEGTLLWTNPAVQKTTGYTIDECKQMKDFPMPLVYADDRDRMAKAYKNALKGGTGREFEFRLCRKDGIVVWADISWQPIYDDKHVMQGFRASIRDIGEKKEAERRLLEIEQKYIELTKKNGAGD